jgi:hypothetical protein
MLRYTFIVSLVIIKRDCVLCVVGVKTVEKGEIEK